MAMVMRRRINLRKLFFTKDYREYEQEDRRKTNLTHYNIASSITKKINDKKNNTTLSANTQETSMNYKRSLLLNNNNTICNTSIRKNRPIRQAKHSQKFYLKNIVDIERKGINSESMTQVFNTITNDDTQFTKMKENVLNEMKKEQIKRKRNKIKEEKKKNNKLLPNLAITKGNNKQKKILNAELNSNITLPFSVIPSKNFSERFRLHDKNQISNFDEMNAKAIEANINKNLGTKKIAFETLDLIIKQGKKAKNVLILTKIKRVLIRAAIDFQRLNISAAEFYSKYNVTTPFSNTQSKELINAVKNRNTDKILKLIKTNKYLLLDFDDFHQTALMWAAKRNCYDVISTMVSLGAPVNSVDITGKTALHYAVINNSLEAVLILLFEMASPFQKDNNGNRPEDYANNKLTSYILKKTSDLHILNMFGKAWDFAKNVRKGLRYIFKYEVQQSFTKEDYHIVEDD